MLQTVPVAPPDIKDEANWWRPKKKYFQDRLDAGHQLGRKLLEIYGPEALRGSILLGLVRGGIVVAKGVLEELPDLDLALDILVCRKIGLPGNKEMGIGALDECGEPHYVKDYVKKYCVNIDSPEMLAIIEEEGVELKRRQDEYREGRQPPALKDRKVIIVDDSIAGGVTMMAGYGGVKNLSLGTLQSLIVAVPVASQRALNNIMNNTDVEQSQFCVVEMAEAPAGKYWDTDHFYAEFPDVADAEVIQILHDMSTQGR